MGRSGSAWPTRRCSADATYLDSGDWTIARFQARGRNDSQFGPFPATGKTIDAPFCELLRWDEGQVVDGQVVEGGIYYDSTTILIQLGHVPAPGQ